MTNSKQREIEFNNSGSLAIAASRKESNYICSHSSDKEKHNFGWQRTCISLFDMFLWCDLLRRQSAQLLKFEILGIIRNLNLNETSLTPRPKEGILIAFENQTMKEFFGKLVPSFLSFIIGCFVGT